MMLARAHRLLSVEILITGPWVLSVSRLTSAMCMGDVCKIDVVRILTFWSFKLPATAARRS